MNAAPIHLGFTESHAAFGGARRPKEQASRKGRELGVTSRGVCAGVLASLFSATAAQAQWTVTMLTPPGANVAYALAASGSRQAGSAGGSQVVLRAGVWDGAASSWLDLHPDGFEDGQSQVEGVDGAHLGGWYTELALGARRACMWSGTPSSIVNLHPTGATSSAVYAIGGGRQGGYARINGATHASLWTGSAASWVDLHPIAGGVSYVRAIGGDQQAGYVSSAEIRACVWSGSAASWVDLHPTGATASTAYATNGARQAGYAQVGGQEHAALWSGTAGSWIDLHPVQSGASLSVARAIHGGMQAGYAQVGGRARACVWSGTAASWVDLHAFLPVGVASSYALGISREGATLYVTGYGTYSASSRVEALLWTRVLCPSDVDDGSGSGHPDGGVTIDDLLYYLSIFESGLIAADVDDGSGTGTPDGGVTIDDLLYYLFRFESGC